ncbi:MAG TPA: DUF882 domain-containing protein [Candidatus Binatia bacterium]|nr:DUF882 domain-containing protein [Candidatus Binatia bacterium]
MARGSRRGRVHAASTDAPAGAARADVVAPDRAPAILSSRGETAGCRTLSLYNVHTGESGDFDYYVDGRYEDGNLRAINHLLRDYHNDEICPIDPDVLNQLYEIRAALGSRSTYTVFSGYRSPETNEAYRRAGARVAEHSFHIVGKAIDVSLPGRDLRQVRAVALAMQAGGVGYYPWDGFVHVDSGPIRRW